MEEFSPYAPPAAGSPGAERARDAGPKKRRPQASPFVAGLLSLFFPGLGHVYARRMRRAVWWLAVLPVGAIMVCGSLLTGGGRASLAILFLALSTSLGLRLATLIDAVWIAGRRPGPRAPVGTIILAGAVIWGLLVAQAFGMRRYLVEAFKIPSGSMIPTLFVGDHVFVEKLHRAGRADLLVFPSPEHPEEDFVKRIIGLPGDTVRFRDGHPIINGVEVPSCHLGRWSYEDLDSPRMHHDGTIYLEKLGDRAYLTFYDEVAGSPNEEGPYHVKEGEAFVVGDNRMNAYDSRKWFGGEGGGVKLASAIGIPYTVWLTTDGADIDWSRLGVPLDSPHLSRSMASLKPELARCLGR